MCFGCQIRMSLMMLYDHICFEYGIVVIATRYKNILESAWVQRSV